MYTYIMLFWGKCNMVALGFYGCSMGTTFLLSVFLHDVIRLVNKLKKNSPGIKFLFINENIFKISNRLKKSTFYISKSLI